MRKFWLLLTVVLGVVVAAFAGALTFGTSTPPARLGAINDAISSRNLAGLPPAETFAARDGEKLTFRKYMGAPNRAVVLVHGSTGRSESVHELAKYLSALPQAPTLYTLDIRGHGLSGQLGDISYIGQLEDDLADFLKARAAVQPSATWSLVGHSSGGGFALRIAGSPVGSKFEKVVLLAPMLDPRGATYRPNGGGWAAPYIPRIIALRLLESARVSLFQNLTAIAFAPRDDGTVPTYTYRLLRNFGVDEAWPGYLKAAPRAPVVLVGGKDELFVPEAFGPMMKSARADVDVTILPGLTHMDMVYHPDALQAIARALGLR
ncbi:MAG: alpha/beta fold hydrolase [Hyphomicrobiaceae bacterium]|nr:alpha/beta fold hydrolase [Hyphomicrobiaceae bacterium]